MTKHAPVLLDLKEIETLTFPATEVNTTLVSKFQISSLLQTSAIIGKRYQDKVLITFSDSEGMKTVQATVWEACLEKVVLKEGMSIPFHRVTRVEI